MASPDELYRDDETYEATSRHFTQEGYKRLNTLISEIVVGDELAVGTFRHDIQQWVQRVSKKTRESIFGDAGVSDVDIESAVEKTLDATIEVVRKGKITKWTDFNIRFYTNLRYRFKCMDKSWLKHASLNAKVPNPHRNGPTAGAPGEAIMEREPNTLPLHETIPSGGNIPAATEEFRADMSALMYQLEEYERKILILCLGLGGGEVHSAEEVARMLKTNPGSVNHVMHRAIAKLRDLYPTREDLNRFMDLMNR